MFKESNNFPLKRQNKSAAAFSPNISHVNNMSLHTSIKYTLLIAQALGFMPVIGICQPKSSSLKFSWLSWRMLYAILSLFGVVFMACAQLKEIVLIKVKMADIHKFCSYVMGVCSSILFLILAKKWPKFVRGWNKVDKAMTTYGWPAKLNTKVNRIILVFMTLVLIEYGFIELVRYMKADFCNDKLEHMKMFNIYLKNKFGNVYSLFNYNKFSAILLTFVNFQIIFSCTFVDVFIMVLSIIFAARLKQIKKKIKTVALIQCNEENVWKDLREDYDRLEQLCNTVNSTLPLFIILSFAGNIILILIQLFNSLHITFAIEKVYLCYSFGFLVLRTTCVCIYGATINDECRRILFPLYNLPDSVYNKEVERLVNQISASSMALSGASYFLIKRDVVLKIAGALVTYELVLIQRFEELLKSDSANSNWVCSS